MKLRLLPVAATIAAAVYATVPANATPPRHDPVTICHATGGGKYVKITVDDDGTYGGHGNHAEDLILAPGADCPQPTPPTTTPTTTTPTTTTEPPIDNLTPPTTAPAPKLPATPICPFPGLGLYNFHDAECVDPTPAADEEAFLSRINQLRAGLCLPPLANDPELTSVGRSWAARMARSGRISHNPDYPYILRLNWEIGAENVGVGGTVAAIMSAFINSPGHYANLINPDLTRVGVGVVHGADGRTYTAHQFARASGDSPAQPCKKPIAFTG